MAGSVLIIESETALARNISSYLSRCGYQACICTSGGEVAAHLENFDPDVVLLDHRLPDADSLEVLQEVRSSHSRTKVIMTTDKDEMGAALAALKAGAHDYLAKPLVLGELTLLLDKTMRQARLEGAYRYYQAREAARSGLARLIGESPSMRALKNRIRRFLESERTIRAGPPPAVLITGEAGTGKELVARAIHFESVRRGSPFIELNCADMPGHRMEAGLFGFERGAFNGGKKSQPGLVEAAQGGTLFLDEIADIGTALQSKLLTLLESRKMRRLGSPQERDADVRLIVATTRSLEKQVENGEFRADLWSRLRIIQVQLPPLRERGDDVVLLAHTFLASQGRRYAKGSLRLTPAAERGLQRHRWPGNVCELRNVIQQAVLVAEGPVIDIHHLMLDPSRSSLDHPLADGAIDPRHEFNLEHMERTMLGTALRRTNGNVSRAARLLGLSRDTLRYRIAKYQLAPDR